ncbi:MAG TPA: methyltransferase domain-containing protein [Pyrinomonadaceae bacterium]|nr:methyltransferase domain-containing protein [Pyrinomonadaceae bacterium]
MLLAYFSPLGPQRSGISDYSEELLPHLADAGAEVTLFVDGFRPSNGTVASRFEVRDYRRDPSALAELEKYDAAVYHMGNDHRYHAGILEAMRARPGVVVFHDFALQDFFLGLARQRGDLRLYLDEVLACHGEEARRAAAESLSAGGTPNILARPTDFPLNCRLARAAEGLVVHSEWARSRFARIAPAVPSAHIQMPIVPPRFSKRHEDGGRDEVRIAIFGLITPGKGIEHALRALSALKGTHRFRYTLVGEPNPFFDVRGLVRDHQMSDRVEVTGHVTLREFERRISETDIALNIRERTVGETSASLCRIMAAGVPAVVAREGWYAELPDDCVVKIDLDETADALLVAYLRRLIEDAPLRARVGENARRHALAEHDAALAAARYVEFIAETVARRPRRAFVASVSADMAALGLGPQDEELLRGVAAEVAALAPEPQTPAQSNGSPGNGNRALSDDDDGQAARPSGRLPKVEGVDYKRAAVEYLGRLSEERRHHLRTKPFYNLAHRPERYKKGDGMDEDTHRHFCDFANMAVALALPAGSRILDVGCGSGWLSEYFARLGYEVTGLDISPALVEMARERVRLVPYGVDHETPLRCAFRVHDIERAPVGEKFDAVVCYDSLHHFEDERAVMRHLADALPPGGVLFILEGGRPEAGSGNEELLYGVMREFETLESPFDHEYLRALLDEHGFAVVGDYLSVNGLFEREAVEGGRLPAFAFESDYHYLTCKKVSETGPASSVPDSRRPGRLLARFALLDAAARARLPPGARLVLPLAVENAGDTLWLTGQTPRPGVVMPAVRIYDAAGQLVSEFHGEPLLPRAVAPGETVGIKIEYAAPRRPGAYTLKLDLVNQHVCWFESHGTEPFVFQFEVE